ncbi:hypothetical protein K438DRAFT_2144277 [Mycena galopus ATCC 62051]|nr:hypothetical protein K438DRAFT_2144277 [Mycena galopus ATCC 62051]
MFFVIINCSSYFYRTHASNVRILMMGASSAIVGLAAGMGSVNVDGDEGAEQGCKLKPQGSGRTGSGWRGRVAQNAVDLLIAVRNSRPPGALALSAAKPPHSRPAHGPNQAFQGRAVPRLLRDKQKTHQRGSSYELPEITTPNAPRIQPNSNLKHNATYPQARAAPAAIQTPSAWAVPLSLVPDLAQGHENTHARHQRKRLPERVSSPLSTCAPSRIWVQLSRRFRFPIVTRSPDSNPNSTDGDAAPACGQPEQLWNNARNGVLFNVVTPMIRPAHGPHVGPTPPNQRLSECSRMDFHDKKRLFLPYYSSLEWALHTFVTAVSENQNREMFAVAAFSGCCDRVSVLHSRADDFRWTSLRGSASSSTKCSDLRAWPCFVVPPSAENISCVGRLQSSSTRYLKLNGPNYWELLSRCEDKPKARPYRSEL